jgi:hypothetical protein
MSKFHDELVHRRKGYLRIEAKFYNRHKIAQPRCHHQVYTKEETRVPRASRMKL